MITFLLDWVYFVFLTGETQIPNFILTIMIIFTNEELPLTSSHTNAEDTIDEFLLEVNPGKWPPCNGYKCGLHDCDCTEQSEGKLRKHLNYVNKIKTSKQRDIVSFQLEKLIDKSLRGIHEVERNPITTDTKEKLICHYSEYRNIANSD